MRTGRFYSVLRCGRIPARISVTDSASDARRRIATDAGRRLTVRAGFLSRWPNGGGAVARKRKQRPSLILVVALSRARSRFHYPARARAACDAFSDASLGDAASEPAMADGVRPAQPEVERYV